MTAAGMFRRRLSWGFLALMVVALMFILSATGSLLHHKGLPEIVAGFTPQRLANI